MPIERIPEDINASLSTDPRHLAEVWMTTWAEDVPCVDCAGPTCSVCEGRGLVAPSEPEVLKIYLGRSDVLELCYRLIPMVLSNHRPAVDIVRLEISDRGDHLLVNLNDISSIQILNDEEGPHDVLMKSGQRLRDLPRGQVQILKMAWLHFKQTQGANDG